MSGVIFRAKCRLWLLQWCFYLKKLKINTRYEKVSMFVLLDLSLEALRVKR